MHQNFGGNFSKKKVRFIARKKRYYFLNMKNTIAHHYNDLLIMLAKVGNIKCTQKKLSCMGH